MLTLDRAVSDALDAVLFTPTPLNWWEEYNVLGTLAETERELSDNEDDSLEEIVHALPDEVHGPIWIESNPYVLN